MNKLTKEELEGVLKGLVEFLKGAREKSLRNFQNSKGEKIAPIIQIEMVDQVLVELRRLLKLLKK